MVNSGSFNGIDSKIFREKIVAVLEEKGLAQRKVNWRLKDWLISRQRYWGTPIPMIYCPSCGIIPVREQDLPVLLPKNISLKTIGESPLKFVDEFVNVKCHKCGRDAKRETDTMDTFFDSSWYFARYCDSKNDTAPFDSEKNELLAPGGPVHRRHRTCVHAPDLRKVFPQGHARSGHGKTDEPFGRLLSQGMVTLGGTAMSKSKGNIVEPSSVMENYGTDSIRLFILFAAPPEKSLEWSDRGIEGMWRFINRVWRLKEKIYDAEPAAGGGSKKDHLRQKLHATIKKITVDMEDRYQLNTCIASLMELVNELYLYPDPGDDISRRLTGTSSSCFRRLPRTCARNVELHRR